jgi:DNA-directed RNA polymerase subunit beta
MFEREESLYGRFTETNCFGSDLNHSFLEHDDASRALMGANMQRQAVPLLDQNHQLLVLVLNIVLLKTQVVCYCFSSDRFVTYVDATKIVITQKPDEKMVVGNQMYCMIQT